MYKRQSVDGATVSLVSLSADNGNPTAIKTYNASGNTYEALTCLLYTSF